MSSVLPPESLVLLLGSAMIIMLQYRRTPYTISAKRSFQLRCDLCRRSLQRLITIAYSVGEGTFVSSGVVCWRPTPLIDGMCLPELRNCLSHIAANRVVSVRVAHRWSHTETNEVHVFLALFENYWQKVRFPELYNVVVFEPISWFVWHLPEHVNYHSKRPVITTCMMRPNEECRSTYIDPKLFGRRFHRLLATLDRYHAKSTVVIVKLAAIYARIKR